MLGFGDELDLVAAVDAVLVEDLSKSLKSWP